MVLHRSNPFTEMLEGSITVDLSLTRRRSLQGEADIFLALCMHPEDSAGSSFAQLRVTEDSDSCLRSASMAISNTTTQQVPAFGWCRGWLAHVCLTDHLGNAQVGTQ